MPRHYLDHASTAPLRPAARAAMVEALDRPAADPGRLHAEGMRARVAIEEAREQVAAFLGARPREVVLTSGATESIVTATRGAAERGRHLVVPAVEHSAVTRSCEALVGAGTHEATVVGVDETGRVDPAEVLAALRPGTALVHLQLGNHEVGTLQPVAEVVAGCRDRGVLIHVDAAQAAGHVPVDFDALGADLLSVSAHKLGGPPGIGALLVRRGLRLTPLLVGGEQERARRAGLENLPALAGFAAACAELAPDRLAEEAARNRSQTERVVAALTGADAPVAGIGTYGDPVDRLPHLVCLGVDGVEPQAVLLGLDRAGIATHSGKACASEGIEPSPVLAAMGVDAERSLRVSVGWDTTDADIDALVAHLPGVVTHLRSLAAG